MVGERKEQREESGERGRLSGEPCFVDTTSILSFVLFHVFQFLNKKIDLVKHGRHSRNLVKFYK